MSSVRPLARALIPAVLLAALAVPAPVQAATRKPAAAGKITIKASSTAVRGARMTVKVTVKPPKKRGRVVLQFHSPRGWKKLVTVHQDRRGRATLTFRPKASGTLKLRAVTIADKSRRAGRSATRSVHVVPAKAPEINAHRGLSSTEPENTIRAYRAALAAGADAVETDIRLTEDGVPVLLHDPTLARTTDVETVYPGRGDDPVGTFTLAELNKLDFGSWKGSPVKGAATFAQLLDLLEGKGIRLIAEIKAPEGDIAGQVVDALGAHKLIQPGYPDPAEVISRHSDVLHEVKDLSPSADVGYISAVAVDMSDWSWVTTLHLKYPTVDAAVMKRARELRRRVAVWTVDGKADAYRLADLGVVGITTNVAGVLGNALRR